MTSTFDADNKQTIVKDSNGIILGRYFYDGEGRRVKKQTFTGEVTIFVYSGGKLVAEYSTQQNPQPQISYTATDLLDSPRVITNGQGQVTSRRDFMPFGTDAAISGSRSQSVGYNSDTVRQKFTGYLKDDETNLEFAEARMYETRHGRFTAVDPLLASGKSANPQTFNRFVYVLNNPLMLTDPSGLKPTYYYRLNENGVKSWHFCDSRRCNREAEADGMTLYRGKLGKVIVGTDNYKYRLTEAGLARMEYVGIGRSNLSASQMRASANAEALRNASAGIIDTIIPGANTARNALGLPADEDSTEYKNAATGNSFVQAGLAMKGLANAASSLPGVVSYIRSGIKEMMALRKVCCFVAGTQIHTANGSVGIEKIKVGDKVLSFDEKTKRIKYKTVASVFTGVKNNIVVLKIAGEGKKLTTTDEHPFYVRKIPQAHNEVKRDGEWRTADELEVGDKVLDRSGKWKQVVYLTRYTYPTVVYNFEVEGNHNYYVGESGILSHNCTASDIANRVVKGFDNLQCLPCANKLLSEFSKAGISGQIREIRSTSNFIVRAGQNSGEAISFTGRHFGVQVGDTIYDLYHPNGIQLDKWATAYESLGDITLVP